MDDSRIQNLLSALPKGVSPVWAEYLGMEYYIVQRPGPGEYSDPSLPTADVDDVTRFAMLVSVRFGPDREELQYNLAGRRVYDLFEFRVTTPRSLADWFSSSQLPHSGIIYSPREESDKSRGWIAPTFVMEQWDLAVFETAMRSLARECGPGPDWPTVAMRLRGWTSLELADRFDELANSQGPSESLQMAWLRER